MSSKRLAAIACCTALVAVGAIIAHSRNHEVPANALSAKSADSVRQITAKVLAQQIAQLEVEEILQRVKFTQDAPQMVLLREQRSSLEKRLAQLQPQTNQQSAFSARAIETKIADLEVQQAQSSAKFADTHPTLQMQKFQIEALHQHLATMK